MTGVISRAKDTHAPNRDIRMRDAWDALAVAVGKRRRAEVILQLVRWYLRYPGAKQPERPTPEDAERAREHGRSLSED